MLILRKEQLESLWECEGTDSFESRLVAYVRRSYPEHEAVSQSDLRQQIRQAGHRALDYGLVSERDVAAFTVLTFALSPTFESDPEYRWALPILYSVQLSPAEKVTRLFAEAVRQKRGGT